MCKCCSGGKNASKYKQFAFLNGHDHDHGADQGHEHGHSHDHTEADPLKTDQTPPAVKGSGRNGQGKEI